VHAAAFPHVGGSPSAVAEPAGGGAQRPVGQIAGIRVAATHTLDSCPPCGDAAGLLRILRRELAWTESACDGLVIDELRGIDQSTAMLRFRWLANPHRLAPTVAFDEQRGPLSGEPMGMPEQWAGEVAIWLLEQLHTGLVAEAGRSFVRRAHPARRADLAVRRPLSRL
jgi:hypothetical protein